MTGKAQEGAAVFWWKGAYWMLVDRWQGMGVLRSSDLIELDRAAGGHPRRPGKTARRRRHRPPRRGPRPGPRSLHLLLHPPLRAQGPHGAGETPLVSPGRPARDQGRPARLRPRQAVPARTRSAERLQAGEEAGEPARARDVRREARRRFRLGQGAGPRLRLPGRRLRRSRRRLVRGRPAVALRLLHARRLPPGYRGPCARGWPPSTGTCSASSPAASARRAISAPTGRSTSGTGRPPSITRTTRISGTT